MKVVLQDGMKDCGICSLLSVIRHYGGNVSKEYLRELTSTTKNGVSAYKLLESAQKLGFYAYALSGDIKNINVNNLPCIAHVIINKSYQHFIVIYEVNLKKDSVIVMDPAKGKRVLSISGFRLMSSECFIFLNPIKKLPILRKSRVVYNIIINFSNKEKKYLYFLFLLMTIYLALNIFTAFHFKYLIEYVINYQNSSNILIINITILVIYLLKEISCFLKNIIILKYCENLDSQITMKIYRQIILLPYLYYKNRTTGEVISRMKDLSYIKDFLAKLITSSITDFICLIIFLFLLIKINPALALFSSILCLLNIIIHFIFKKSLKSRRQNYYRKEEKANSYLIESLTSVDVIKGMHVEKIMVDRFLLKYKSLLESVYSLSIVEELFLFLKKNIYNITYVIILSFGAFLVLDQKINLSDLILFQSFFTFFNSSFQSLLEILHEYPNFIISIERIEDLFTIRKEIFKGGELYSSYNVKGNIVYNNLTYSYGKTMILKDINLTIKQGDKVFLYGSSGSGKSTLMKLLMRYIEVEFGNISINGIDINHYHLNNLREHITYISQQEFLYTDTIYNNITLRKDITKEKVEEVSKLTLVNEIIKDDQLSFDKLVEENGFNFSGGERQRLILARTILKDSSIYIFDEALSQIDIERERKILKNIFKYLKKETIIVISHRFDNKDLFNRILKLENGMIYEEKL